MDTTILRTIGLTTNEIKIYITLLKIGLSTAYELSKKTDIYRVHVYDKLEQLMEKGLVTHVIKSGTKYYQAKDPEQLLDYMDEKEKSLIKKKEKLKKIIPVLKAQYEEKKYKPIAEVYEGVKGFKTFYEWTLKELEKGETIHIMGVPKEANKKFEGYLVEWNKKRIQKGIKMKIIYNHDCKEFGIKREKMKFTEVRYMKQEFETPAWIDIFKDYVVTINVHGTPVCFLIKNKESADSYKKHFEILWKQSKK